MPEVVDEDENAYFVRPDDGGPAIRMAKTPGLLESIGAVPPTNAASTSGSLMSDTGLDKSLGPPMGPSGEAPTPPAETQPTKLDGGGQMPQFGLPPLSAGSPEPVDSSLQGVTGSGDQGADARSTRPPNTSANVSSGELGKLFKDQQDAQKEVQKAAGEVAKVSQPLPVPQPVITPGGVVQTPQAQGVAPTPGVAGAKPAQPSAVRKAEGELTSAMEREKKANEEIGNIAQRAANEKAFAMSTDAMAADEFATRQEEKARLRAEKIGTEIGKLQTLQDDYKSSKVDPDKALGNIGSQIAAAIGRALGIFGSSMTGQPDVVGQQIDEKIRQRIAAQRDEINKKGEAIDQQKNMIAQLRQGGFDEAQQDSAAYVLQMEAAKKKLEGTIAADAPEEVKQRAAALSAQFDQRIAAEKQRFAIASQPKAMSFAHQMEMAKFKESLDKDKRERLVTMPDGSAAFARTQKEAEHINDAEETRARMNEKLDMISEIVQNNLGHTIAGPEKAKLEGLQGDLKTDFAVMKKLGAISKEDDVLATQFASPTAFTTADSTVLDSINGKNGYKARINAGHMTMLKKRGLLGGSTPAAH